MKISEEKRAYNRSYYSRHRHCIIARERAKRRVPEYRVKERERYKRRREQVLAHARAYYIKNRDRISATHRKYRISNSDYIKRLGMDYRKNNRELLNAKNAIYAKSNRSKVNLWNRKWRQKNPSAVQASESRRRAKKFGATIDASAVTRFYQWIKNQDYLTCTYCGKYICGKSVEIDHIVPLTRGGAHDPDNFCVSCRVCNSSKNDRLLSEWPKCPEKFRRN